MLARSLPAAVLLLAAACSGGRKEPPSPPAEASGAIGPAGGTLEGPDGVRLAVPAAALEQEITFRIARDATGAPPTAGMPLASPVYAVTPHGSLFAADALLRIPFDAARVPAGGRAAVVRADPGGGWRLLPEVGSGAARLADLQGLSYFAVVACGPDLICGGSTFTLEYLDGASGLPIPAARDPATGLSPPLGPTVAAPATLRLRATWRRPAGTDRQDTIGLSLSAGLSPVGPASVAVPAGVADFSHEFQVAVDPAAVPLATVRTAVSRLAARVVGASGFFCWQATGCVAGFDVWAGFQIPVEWAGSPPVISQAPSDQAVREGEPAAFAVIAVGPALTYRWAVSADGGVTFAPLASTGPSHAVAAAALADDGSVFRVTVCSASGIPPRPACVDRSARLAVSPRPSAAPAFQPPLPGDQTLAPGASAALQVTAVGEPAPRVAFESYDPQSGSWAEVAQCPAVAGQAGSTTAACTVGPLALADSGLRLRAHADNGVLPDAYTPEVTVTVRPPAPAGACLASGGAQGWCWVAPAPQGSSLRAAAFDAGGLLALGPSGVAQRTADGGTSWSVSYASRLGWTDVAAPAPGLLVAATLTDGVQRSVDGGASWSQVAQPFRNLGAVSFGDAARGVAVGQLVLRTTDGGATWSEAFPEGGYGLIAAAHASPSVAVAVGTDGAGSGIVLRTADGGATWAHVLSTVALGSQVRSVAFGAGGVGIATGDSGASVLRTADGGATWSEVALPALGVPNLDLAEAVAFAGGSTAVIVTRLGELLRSTDAGTTFASLGYPAGRTAGSFALRFADAQRGALVGSGGLVALTADGGATWRRVAGGLFPEVASGVRFAPDGYGLAGVAGGLLRSDDGGATWIGTSLPSGLARFAFPGPGAAVALDRGGAALHRSSDSGRSWSRVLDEPSLSLAALDFDGAVGLAVGAGGAVRRSADGGLTWAAVAPGTAVNLSAVAFGGPSLALAAGEGGTLLRTEDGGLTWSAPPLPAALAGRSFRAVAFASGQVALAATADGLVCRSADGGLTWAEVAVPPGDLQDLALLGQAGVAVGSSGRILVTADGGLTWSDQSQPVDLALLGAGWAGPSTAVAVGEYGAILRNTAGGASGL